MRIAITGGSGRVGRATVALALRQGHQVVSIDRTAPAEGTSNPALDSVTADLAHYPEVEAALRGCAALVHLAAIPQPGHHPDHEVHNNNVVGSYNALRAAAEIGIERVCQASSINAIGAAYSRAPRYDYLPLDEQHPTYNEDPYSLSKWICEQQADSFARRYATMRIASLRFHWVLPDPSIALNDYARPEAEPRKHMWAWTKLDAAARACLLALVADFNGHEVFYIVAPTTLAEVSTIELAQEYFAEVPLRGDLSDRRGFFNCAKAEQLLGWHHDTRLE